MPSVSQPSRQGLLFDPIRLVDGIELSGDPLLMAGLAVYAISPVSVVSKATRGHYFNRLYLQAIYGFAEFCQESTRRTATPETLISRQLPTHYSFASVPGAAPDRPSNAGTRAT